MKVNAEDLRKHYASLSDEGLLALQTDDLLDVARACYDEEVARRGLLPPESAPGPDAAAPFPVESAEPLPAASFTNVRDARLARSVLQAEQIPCYLENEHVSWTAGTEAALRLMVPSAYVDRATELLSVEAPAGVEQTPPDEWDGSLRHSFVETNGIRMHYAEAGSGPLVLLLHGFPESWHSWRHQLKGLAAEGYHVVAPDMRGYGQTDRPPELEAYDIFQLTGDIVGLVNALGEAPAVLVGHDWGAWIAPYAALFRPDLFRAVALLSVPYVPRRAVNESQWEQQKYPGKIFYQAMLRSPMGEQYFAADVRARLLAGLWTLSGDVAPELRAKPVRDPDEPLPQASPAGLPKWLTNEDLDFLTAEFQRTGFTGGLNYYRNMDRNWELTPFLDGARLLHRTLFLAGENDPVLGFLDDELDNLETNVPNLWQKAIVEGAGHWIQEERPDQVNQLLIAFLSEIEAGVRAQL